MEKAGKIFTSTRNRTPTGAKTSVCIIYKCRLIFCTAFLQNHQPCILEEALMPLMELPENILWQGPFLIRRLMEAKKLFSETTKTATLNGRIMALILGPRSACCMVLALS